MPPPANPNNPGHISGPDAAPTQGAPSAVGLFLGSFNPIHVGHVLLAQTVLARTNLQAVWLVISPQNPLKPKEGLANAYYRYRLAQLATQHLPHVQPTAVEFGLPRPSYTITTLRTLGERHPETRFALVMGADTLATLPRWRDHDHLLDNYPIIVYPRNEGPRETPSWVPAGTDLTWLRAPLMEFSSTDVRQRLAQGQPVRYLVPEAAEAYIRRWGLYTS